jgi:hypothetical protein
LLGTRPDEVVADELGRTRAAVQLKRHALEIPPIWEHRKVWTPKEKAPFCNAAASSGFHASNSAGDHQKSGSTPDLSILAAVEQDIQPTGMAARFPDEQQLLKKK